MNKQELINYLQTIHFSYSNDRVMKLNETGAIVLVDEIMKYGNDIKIDKRVVGTRNFTFFIRISNNTTANYFEVNPSLMKILNY